MANIAISLGVGIGARLLFGLLSPKKAETIEGSRLGDLEVQRATLGSSIPVLFGITRINALPVFWSPKIKEERTVRRRRVSAKGGRGSVSRETEYKYYGNFAVLVGQPANNGVQNINRIWLNGELYYNDGVDVTGQNRIQSNSSQVTKEIRLSQHLEFYLGTDFQEPSPTIESFEGSGNVPAFRKKCYIVFRDLPLANFGNRLPRVDVEVIERNNLKVSDIVKYLCEFVALKENEDFLLKNIDFNIDGFQFSRSGDTLRSAIEELQQVYMFLCRDNGSVIEFFPFDRSASTLSVTPAQLGRYSDGAQFYERKITSDIEIPREVQLKAKNILSNHDPMLKSDFRPSKTHNNTLILDTKITTKPQELANSASKLLEFLWLKKEKYASIIVPAFNIGAINAGDRMNIQFPNRTIEVFVETIKTGANYEMEIEGSSWNGDIDSFVAPVQTQSYDDDWELPDLSDPTPIPLDLPLLSDADSDYGIYVGLKVPDSWNTGILYGKIGSSEYEEIADIALGVISGKVSAPTPARSQFIIDEFTIIDVLIEGDALNALSSCTYNQFLSYKNLALIGNELIAFQNAIIQPDGKTYRLSKLLRGCRGTESAIAGHVANEKFYLVKDPGFIQHEGLPAYLGQTATYAGVPDGGSILNITNEASITITGEAAKPYAPVNPILTLNSETGALTLSWDRRTRRDGDWRDGVNVPIGEESEQYEVIRNGISHFVSSPSFTFTGTAPITATVHQLSASVGRGKPLNISGLNVTRII